MLFKKIKYSLILAFCSALTFTSCNNDFPSSSPSENSSESVNVSSSVSEQPYVRDENYQWSIENQDYLHGKVDVLVGTTEEHLDVMVTKVGDQTFKADGNFNFESTLNYIGDTINSDNSNRAADFLYVNGQKLKRIVSDGAKGVTIDENLLLQGENTLTVKIGPYWTDNDYDENKNHGNKWQSCDDFGLQDVHLTLPTKEILYPKTIVRYYPIKVGIPVSQNNTKIVEEDYNPTINERLGDGWGQFDSYYGNPENNYRYNIPYKIDFIFTSYPKYDYYAYHVDSNLVSDGNYEISLVDGDKPLIKQTIGVDNTAPTINCNIKDNSIVNIDLEKVEGSFADAFSGIKETYVTIDGVKCEKMPASFDKEMSPGKHTILFYAKDKAENTTFVPIEFFASKIGAFKNYQKQVTNEKIKYTSDSQFKMVTYDANPSTLTLKEGNSLNSTTIDLTTPKTSTLEDGIPYHSFSFNVSNDTEKVFVKYDGGTNEYERFAIKAKNNKNGNLDTIITGYGQEVLQFTLDVANYKTNNNVVEMIVTNDLVTNGGDTLMWVTDTQHYTKFDDLNSMLYEMMEYCADEYTKGSAAYFLHTGDLVDDSTVSTTDTNLITKEWNVADTAHKIIEKVGMPSGVVTGNHDTGTSLQTLTYDNYQKYFGQDRFNNQPWYGGSLNNNASHYDLVTIGDIDFMFVYLGYGVEGDEDTICWANNVIKRYPHRNVVLATHDYLAYNNGNGITSTTSRYNEIFNQIIVPNDNVIMVLCGHDNGAFHREVKIPNSTRVVNEILSDYQFVDLGDPNKHKIGDYPGCSGSGFLRKLRFTKDGLENRTWSTHYEKTQAFGEAQDNFDLKLNYVGNQRLLVSNSIEVFELTNAKETSLAKSQSLNLSGNKYVVRLEDANGNYTYELI